VYTNVADETLRLEHKNTLLYTNGQHIAKSQWLTYNLYNDTLNIQRKMVAMGTQDVFNKGNVYGQKFKVYNDSLVNIDNGGSFYSPEYLRKEQRLIAKKELYIYVIFEGKKHKITKRNINSSILMSLNYDDYTLTRLEPEVANNLYGIPQNYSSIQITKK